MSTSVYIYIYIFACHPEFIIFLHVPFCHLVCAIACFLEFICDLVFATACFLEFICDLVFATACFVYIEFILPPNHVFASTFIF